MDSLTSIAALRFHNLKFPSMDTPVSTSVPSFSISMAFRQRSPKSPRRLAKFTKAIPPTSSSPSSTSTSTTTSTDNTMCVSPKKVLVPIGYGTEEIEAVVIVDVLRRAGAEVTVASVEQQLEVEASSGTKLVADTFISSCSNQIFDLVALPGGMPGSVRLRDCQILQKITCKQAEERRLFGAICAAPAVTLLPWGLLRKKHMTGHPAFMDKLPTFWAVKSNIQVSGGLTTSRGPGTSFEFALCLVEQLFGEFVAKEVADSLLAYAAADESRKEEFNEVAWSVDHIPRVLIPIANGSEEIEVVTVADILRRAKVDVVVASVEKTLKILGSQGTKIVADMLISRAAESTYDLIILPGGNSRAERLHKSRILIRMLKEQELAGRIYGAVCSSLEVLQKQGLLKDKRATAHPSETAGTLINVVNGARVVIDGKLITSRGLATVADFALDIVSKLFGHARARSVAEGLVYYYPRI